MNCPYLNPRLNISVVDSAYGDGGSRTRVRRFIDKDFYHHSRFIWCRALPGVFPIPNANQQAKGFGSFLIFYRFKATGGKVPCISRPGFGYAGLPEPTTALIKPQMRNYYCRFFFKGWQFFHSYRCGWLSLFSKSPSKPLRPRTILHYCSILQNGMERYAYFGQPPIKKGDCDTRLS